MLPLKSRRMAEKKSHKFCWITSGELLARPTDQVGLITQTVLGRNIQ